MINIYKHVVYISTVALLVSCAGLQKDFKEPTVSVTSFRALALEGMALRFEIGLHVINPNRMAIVLEGMSYTVSIEGRQILAGVENDLPMIEAYGEGDITLTATADLINSISLFADLVRQPRDTFTYKFAANLDLGGIYSGIPIENEGRISLAPMTR